MSRFFPLAVAAVVVVSLAGTGPARAQYINMWGQPSNQYGQSIMPPAYYASLYYASYPYYTAYRPYPGRMYGPYYFGTAGPYFGGPAANYYYYSYWNAPYNLTPYPYAPYYTPPSYYGTY
jgi:hypothetical protein